MKKLLLSLFCLCAISAMGKGIFTLESGDASVLKQAGALAVVEFDYSKTMVKEQKLNDYLKSRGDDFVRDWPKDKIKAQSYFPMQFNKTFKKGMHVSESGATAPYKMVMHIDWMDEGSGGASFIPMAGAKAGGVIVRGSMDVVDTKTQKVICKISFDNVKGMGHPSETVRIGMAYMQVAKELGKFLK